MGGEGLPYLGWVLLCLLNEFLHRLSFVKIITSIWRFLFTVFWKLFGDSLSALLVNFYDGNCQASAQVEREVSRTPRNVRPPAPEITILPVLSPLPLVCCFIFYFCLLKYFKANLKSCPLFTHKYFREQIKTLKKIWNPNTIITLNKMNVVI